MLSGPSHAEEVGRGLPTTCVVGAKTKETAEYLQKMFMNETFRVYTSPDILGIEVGGALKMSLHSRLELRMVSDTVIIQRRRLSLVELRRLEDLVPDGR